MYFSEKEAMRPTPPGDLEAQVENAAVPQSPSGSTDVTVVGSNPNCEIPIFL